MKHTVSAESWIFLFGFGTITWTFLVIVGGISNWLSTKRSRQHEKIIDLQIEAATKARSTT